MTKFTDVDRLDAIFNGASKLTIENQECVLSTIRGMLFTRKLLMKQAKRSCLPPKDHSV